MKSTAIFRCPSNPNRDLSASQVVAAQPLDIKVSYACNYSSDGSGLFANFDGTNPVNEAMIESPAELIAITESLATDSG